MSRGAPGRDALSKIGAFRVKKRRFSFLQGVNGTYRPRPRDACRDVRRAAGRALGARPQRNNLRESKPLAPCLRNSFPKIRKCVTLQVGGGVQTGARRKAPGSPVKSPCSDNRVEF